MGEDAWDWADRLQTLADEAYIIGIPLESVNREATLKFICGLTDKGAQDYILSLSHKKRDSISAALKRYHTYVQLRQRDEDECYTKHTPSRSHNWYKTDGHCSESLDSRSPSPQPHSRQRRSDDCYKKYASSKTCDSSDCRSPSPQPPRRKSILKREVTSPPAATSNDLLDKLETKMDNLTKLLEQQMAEYKQHMAEQREFNEKFLDALTKMRVRSRSCSSKSKSPPPQPQRDRKKTTPCAVNYTPSIERRLHKLESSVTQLNQIVETYIDEQKQFNQEQKQINQEQKQFNQALLDALEQLNNQRHRSHTSVPHKLRDKSDSKDCKVQSPRRQEIVGAEKMKEQESSEHLQLTVTCAPERCEPTNVLGTSAKENEAQTETKTSESNGPITQKHIDVHASTELIKGLLAQEQKLNSSQNMPADHQFKATPKSSDFEIVDANHTWDPGIRLHLLVLMLLLQL